MVPTIANRLRSMIKAMQEVVIPAVDPEHAIAQEQAKLVLGSLNLILQQVDFAHAFEVIDARDQQSLARELAGLIDPRTGSSLGDIGAVTEIDRHTKAIEDPTTATDQLQQINRVLRDTVAGLIAQSELTSDPNLISKITARVLHYSAAQLIRERSWAAGTGFDGPGTLPQIADALRTTTHHPGVQK
ncbi:MAG: hypothetical protein ACREXT_06280 [Gammaproteobacteria bacterium]